ASKLSTADRSSSLSSRGVPSPSQAICGVWGKRKKPLMVSRVWLRMETCSQRSGIYSLEIKTQHRSPRHPTLATNATIYIHSLADLEDLTYVLWNCMDIH